MAMFEKIEADIYIIVDGDDTYPAESIHELIKPVLEENVDMTVGTRLRNFSSKSFRPFHVQGNHLILK